MTIELTRKHALLFAVLFATQMVGLHLTFSRSPVLAGLPRSVWWLFFSMVPGSSFLTTIILVALLRVVFSKHGPRVVWWWLLIFFISIAIWLLARHG